MQRIKWNTLSELAIFYKTEILCWKVTKTDIKFYSSLRGSPLILVACTVRQFLVCCDNLHVFVA